MSAELNAVVDALSAAGNAPRRSGSGYKARCPAHEDRQPSLSLSEGTSQPVIANCHAGCTFEQIMDALGLTLADVLAPGWEKVHPYSSTVAKVRSDRNGGRPARQWRSVTHDGVLASRGDAGASLYRVGDVAAARAAGARVWLCEGETDCDAVRALGEYAVSVPNGAASWAPEFAAEFAGAEVWFIPDDDDAGRRFAMEAMPDLDAMADSVRLLRPVRGKDVRAHLEAGGTLDDVEDLTARHEAERHRAAVEQEAYRERVKVEGKARAADQIAAADPRLAQAVGGFQVLADTVVRPVEWRVDRLMPRGGRVLLVAPQKTGKTTLLVGLARALHAPYWVASNFLGRFPCAFVTGTVALLSYEMPQEMTVDWLRRGKVDERRTVVNHLRGMANPLASGVGRRGLAEALKQHQAEVLLIDTFSRAFRGFGDSENDAAQVGDWCSAVDEVADLAGVGEVLVTHHANAGGRQARGSTALTAWPDAVWYLRRASVGSESEDEGPDVRIFSAEGRGGDVEAEVTRYDEETLTVTLTGQSHSQWSRAVKAEALWLPAREAMLRAGSLSMRGIAAAIREAGGAVRTAALPSIVEEWEEAGRVVAVIQPGTSTARYMLGPNA